MSRESAGQTKRAVRNS